jgi:hypothetical protein
LTSELHHLNVIKKKIFKSGTVNKFKNPKICFKFSRQFSNSCTEPSQNFTNISNCISNNGQANCWLRQCKNQTNIANPIRVLTGSDEKTCLPRAFKGTQELSCIPFGLIWRVLKILLKINSNSTTHYYSGHS